MKKFIFSVIFLFVFIMPLLNVYAVEKASPVFDDRPWKLGWSRNQEGAVYEEYVLDGETVENWSELVTIQFFPGLNKKMSPDAFEARQKADLSSVCPSLNWESIYQSEDERIWKWNITGCLGQPDQAEIARLKKTDEGFHIWHYAIKKSSILPEKERIWLEKLRAIEIIKSE